MVHRSHAQSPLAQFDCCEYDRFPPYIGINPQDRAVICLCGQCWTAMKTRTLERAGFRRPREQQPEL